MTAIPKYVVPTGDFIAEWMEGEGINAAEFARRLEVTPKHISELLSGKAPLSHPLGACAGACNGSTGSDLEPVRERIP